VRLLSILSVHVIKCAKVRAFLAKNKVLFARVEQLCYIQHLTKKDHYQIGETVL